MKIKLLASENPDTHKWGCNDLVIPKSFGGESVDWQEISFRSEYGSKSDAIRAARLYLHELGYIKENFERLDTVEKICTICSGVDVVYLGSESFFLDSPKCRKLLHACTRCLSEFWLQLAEVKN